MAHLLISAAHKSSGKTTVTLGLCAALKAQGLSVQAFKKGPDYIDPLWLSQAAGRSCHNLDFYTMDAEEIVACVAEHLQTADIGLIEGNKGLYDGLDLAGSNSNAALAHLLGAPVVLVLDTQGMTRGIAPLVLGYQHFDPELQIAGVILNQVGGQRHETKLRQALERYTDIPLLGAIHRDPQLGIVERHLGLMPSNEDQQAQHKIATIGQAISQQVDLGKIVRVGQQAASLPQVIKPQIATAPKVTLGVIRDAAFGFY
ncbi:MAG: cobyrinate a,c-diamide synthase, partial [Pseudomonadota bacterium]|nr:cobyrinate a,c-diamide synthase [Pseudomonadota bacterium]